MKDAPCRDQIGRGACEKENDYSSCTCRCSQVTLLFQSTNAPFGLSRHAQTCNSKKSGNWKRFGATTNWKSCPSSVGGAAWYFIHVAASTMYSTPTSLRALPTGS